MKRYLIALCVGLTPVLAQEAGEETLPPPATTLPASAPADGDREPEGEVDGSMRRALAYSQRGMIKELLTSPQSLSASAAPQLARELRIPEVHAQLMIERASQAGKPLTKLNQLLQFGLPEGKTAPAGTKLDKMSDSQLRKKLGMTAEEIQRFKNYRESARRVHNRFREIRAVQEARRLGAELTSESLAKFAKGTAGDRVRLIADALGYGAQRSPLSEAKQTEERRARELRVGEQVGQVMARYRDPNGRINWSRFGASEVGGTAAGFGQFAFALFLKELAVAAQSGEPERLNDFLDQLTSQEFLVDYTLFVAGARAADRLYGKRIRHYFHQGSMSNWLRSNFVLAAGLAVPQVARGEFHLDTYGVDLVALSMSVTAVHAASSLARGALGLVPQGKRPILRGGKLFNVAGWVYTAGETAVVLILSDSLAGWLDRMLEERKLRQSLRDAGDRLQSFVSGDGETLSLEELEETLLQLNAVYQAARSSSAQPLLEASHEYQKLVAGVVGLIDDETAKAGEIAERLPGHARLAELMRERAATESEARIAELDAELATLNAEFASTFNGAVNEAYTGGATAEEAPAAGSKLALYEEQLEKLISALEVVEDPDTRRRLGLEIAGLRAEYTLDETLLAALNSTQPEAAATTADEPQPTELVPADAAPGLATEVEDTGGE